MSIEIFMFGIGVGSIITSIIWFIKSEKEWNRRTNIDGYRFGKQKARDTLEKENYPGATKEFYEVAKVNILTEKRPFTKGLYEGYIEVYEFATKHD